MSKHTKGNWWFRLYAGDDALIAFQREHGREPVRMLTNEGQMAVMCGDENSPSRIALVDCHVSYKRGKGGETECAQRDANAALIAAAPELAAAVVGLLEVAEGKHPNPHMAIDYARDAVAKAGYSERA